jgi:Tripartite tricarboxylate transporter TctB family
VKIRSRNDFWCGLVFCAIGLAIVALAQQYRMGTAARMGPAYFPTLLGAVLALLGLSLTVPAMFIDGEPFPRLHLRPLLMILAGIAAFGVLLEPFGFVLAVAALAIVAGFAEPELRLVESIGNAVLLAVFCVAIFVLLLGLPLNLWPKL